MVVWEAKRNKKGEPISLTLAGPYLPQMLHGWGLTIEEAVASALRTPSWLQLQPGLAGAIARLDAELYRLRWAVMAWAAGEHPDDFVPF